MDIVIEQTDYLALLAKITGTHDNAVVRDNIGFTWSLWHDVDYWANTVTKPLLDMEEEILAPEIIIKQANLQWFIARSPLAVLWTPGTVIII